MQYSITNLDAFFIILALGYLIHYPNGTFGSVTGASSSMASSTDISFISQLKGQFQANPILGLSLAVCLFSMAGIPPLVGFFAKYMVLYSAIENGYYFLALVGILASVVSAAYYLRIIRVIHFDTTLSENSGSSHQSGGRSTIARSVDEEGQVIGDHQVLTSNMSKAHMADDNTPTGVLSSTHSYVIAVLTLFVILFILSPSLFLNSSNLLALSLFTT